MRGVFYGQRFVPVKNEALNRKRVKRSSLGFVTGLQSRQVDLGYGQIENDRTHLQIPIRPDLDANTTGHVGFGRNDL